ncbi:hypothetical protein [Lactococcus garvieae]|uniref:hypothetical protein n=1 Tax=Lactococcus garvieae TaxID=1363 RepID=UPI0022E53C1C|nr:hypothetical protein [Lactococcus garvieae]
MLSILIFEATAPSIIHQKNFAVQYLTKVTTSVSADDLNDDSSIDDENLQKLIDNPEEIINTQQMTPEELKNFEEAAQQEAEKADLPTQEDREAYKKTLMDLYDPNSSVYQDLQGATDRLIEEINENHQSVLDKVTSEHVLAGAINVGLVAVTGGAAGAGVKALVLKVGAKKAANTISKKVVATLFTFGIKKVSGIDTVISSIVKNILDPGTTVAKWLDSRDKIKNNGWLEWW